MEDSKKAYRKITLASLIFKVISSGAKYGGLIYGISGVVGDNVDLEKITFGGLAYITGGVIDYTQSDSFRKTFSKMF